MPEDFDPYATRKFSRAEITAAEQKEKRTMIRYPDYLPQLEATRPSLVGKLLGLTPDTEALLYNKVVAFREEDGGYMYGPVGDMKHVSPEDPEYPSLPEFERLANQWSEQMSLLIYEDSERDNMEEKLRTVLRSRGIELGSVPQYAGDDMLLTYHVITLLPDAYFAHGTLKRIDLNGDPGLSELIMREQVGNFDPENKIASMDPVGLAQGYKFTFAGVLMHELGHPVEMALLAGEHKAQLKTAYMFIKGNDAFLNTELGATNRIKLSADMRHDIQAESVNEFIAETFMMYLSQGDRLREHIKSFPIDSEISNAWLDVYKYIRDALGKVEYTNGAEQTS